MADKSKDWNNHMVINPDITCLPSVMISNEAMSSAQNAPEGIEFPSGAFTITASELSTI